MLVNPNPQFLSGTAYVLQSTCAVKYVHHVRAAAINSGFYREDSPCIFARISGLTLGYICATFAPGVLAFVTSIVQSGCINNSGFCVVA